MRARMQRVGLFLSGILVLLGANAAAASCPLIGPNDAIAAQSCLENSTRFLSEATSAVQNGFSSFTDLLPPDYEAAGKYSEVGVDQVIDWATASDRTPEVDLILYEASFRKASAHAMWGDEALLRGLDPSSGGGGIAPEEVASEALQRLDSRVCWEASSPSSETDILCTSDRSCPNATPVCAPRGYPVSGDTAKGPYGALQEYRRAESALLAAIQVLGIDGFAALDASQPQCLGAGCAARLLVRIGAMKARAQAERAELLWRQAVARTGLLDETLTCSQGRVGELCVINADCDVIAAGTVSTSGACGSPASVSGSHAETDAVLLREFVQEAIAEAAVAETVYRELLGEDGLASSSDWTTRAAALGRLETVEQRSFAGQNPFGLPSDYVPILRNTQQDLLSCLSTCTSGGGLTCDATSNLQCLRNLVEGADLLDFFAQARAAQASATQNAQAYADRTVDRMLHRDEMNQEFRRVIVRLLGEPSCSGSGCSCPSGIEGEVCVEFGENLWIAEGLLCDAEGLSAEVPTCSLSGVDGEFERQAVAMQLANLVVDDKLRELADNLEQMEAEEKKFAALRGLKAAECQDLETAIETAQEALSTAISEREKNKKFKKGWLGKSWSYVLDGVTKAREELGDVPVVGGALVAPFELAPVICDSDQFKNALKAADPVTQIAAEGGCRAHKGAIERKKKRAEKHFQRDKIAIDFAQQIDTLQARCRTELGASPDDPNACNPEDPFSCGLLGVQQGEALLQLTLRRREITADLAQARLSYVDAMSGSEQLLVQLQEARSRLDEASEHLAIANALGFRNPANYRAVALRDQLAAADKFRAAQIVTWMILRAVAYDLGRPDVATGGQSPLQLASCQAARCDALSSNAGAVCLGDADCSAGGSGGGVCELQTDASGVADSDGGCSLRAVFAARTVDDLEGMVSSALTQVVAADRPLACNGGVCSKTIRLRDLYSDPFAPPATRPNLGDLLVRHRPTTDPALSVLPFAISPRRGFLRCSLNPNGIGLTCQTSGVANLSGEQGNIGDDASNIWLARVLSVEGQVVYEPGRNPGSVACRDTLTGRLANSSQSVCQDVFGNETPFAQCPLEDPPPSGITGCFDAFGNPAPCICQRLLTTQSAPLETRLRQVQPGIVRTREAGFYAPPSAMDRLLRFTMRSGDLPLVSGTLSDRVPSFDPFTVGLTLADADDTTNPPTKQTEIKGVPIASPGWELRVLPSSRLLRPEDFMDEYLRSIQDIELTFEYQGFDIQ